MALNIIYLLGIIAAGSITSAMLAHLWINRKILDSDLAIVLLGALWLWIASQIGECVVSSLAVKIFLYKIKFFGISFVCVSWFCFCLHHVIGRRSSCLVLFFILLFPMLVFNMFSLFDFFQALFWKRFFVAPNNLLLDIEPNTGYLLFNIYGLILIFFGFFTLFVSIVSGKVSRKIRFVPFLLSAAFPICAGFADLIFKQAFFYYKLLPIALALSSLAIIYYLRLRYFRTIPLAQHVVVESMTDCLFILSPDNHVVYMNPESSALFPVPPEEIVGRPLAECWESLHAILGKTDDTNARREEIVFQERVFDVNLSFIRNRRGNIVNKVFVLRDITQLKQVEENLRDITDCLDIKVEERTRELAETNQALKTEIGERMKAEEKIKASLEEKSVLLGELHHRVKNNLQIVSSLLRLQSHYIRDKQARELFDISVSRIRSIAMVHEKLYKSEDIARTRFREYIHDLAHSIIFSHSKTSEQVSLKLDIADIHLDIDKSILCGLIVNELIINSLKHAFVADVNAPQKNKIAVAFRILNGEYELVVQDNGSGIPPDFRLEKAESLGMKIIMTLVKQLGGSIDFEPSHGTKAVIRFPRTDF